jgi:hypothetical protein
MITTKVRQLTRMNINALRDTQDVNGNMYITYGATYVIFEGDPRQALTAVERAMAAQSSRNTTYRSLEAVRRKLRPAAPYQPQAGVSGVTKLTKLTNYVQIAR